MKRFLPLFLVLMIPAWLRAQTVTQTFSLKAGWNAIWLEVTPSVTDVGQVFGSSKVEAVWTFQKRLSAVDYIQDVNEPVWSRDQWLLHVPLERIESINNNLFHVFGQRAYLVKMSADDTLTVTGRPELSPLPWAPDAYNLRGYPIDPSGPPTFSNFFRYSAAHFHAVSNRLERIYKLNATGSWVLAGPGELMQRGVAYWTYCRGSSDYQAPLMLGLEQSGGLDFSESIAQASLALINRTDAGASVTLRDTSGASPLSYLRFSPTNAMEWGNLTGTVTNLVPTGVSLPVRLSVRRGAMSQASYGSILEVRNGAGTRWLVPVSARRQAPAGGSSPRNFTGLWAGNVAISSVNEVNHPSNPTQLTPVRTEFNLRLLLHVDAAGVTRLLREVTQLWREGTVTPGADGVGVVTVPGRYVLVTDERLFPTLRGSVMRDGVSAGRRLSSAGFDFPTAADANYLQMSGAFGSATTPVAGSFTLPATFARQPFLHRYHPDHDNLDSTFTSYREEAYPVTRALELRFSPTDPTGGTGSDYGYRVIAGTYRETLTGLHQKPLLTGGTFRLHRLSEIGALNQ